MPYKVESGSRGRIRRERVTLDMLLGVTGTIIVGVCLIAILFGDPASSKTLSGANNLPDDTAASAEGPGITLGSSPQQARAYLSLADHYMSSNLNDLSAAAAALERATASDSGNAAAYLKLGTVQMLLGHSESALRALEKHKRLSSGG